MMKKNTGEYSENANQKDGTEDVQLKSHDQELIFDTGVSNNETHEETKNIDDITIDIGSGRDQDVIQHETTQGTNNTTTVDIEQDPNKKELVFKPQNQTNIGRMSLKGGLTKAADGGNLRDEPFIEGR